MATNGGRKSDSFRRDAISEAITAPTAGISLRRAGLNGWPTCI
jgi:hypothetical protein